MGTFGPAHLGSKSRKGASLDTGGRPYHPFASELWVANYFSSEKRSALGSANLWAHVHFDFEAAEREIRKRADAMP